MTPAEIEARIEAMLRQPMYFRDIIAALSEESYRSVLQAWSAVRTRHNLERDEHGRYLLAG